MTENTHRVALTVEDAEPVTMSLDNAIIALHNLLFPYEPIVQIDPRTRKPDFDENQPDLALPEPIAHADRYDHMGELLAEASHDLKVCFGEGWEEVFGDDVFYFDTTRNIPVKRVGAYELAYFEGQWYIDGEALRDFPGRYWMESLRGVLEV